MSAGEGPTRLWRKMGVHHLGDGDACRFPEASSVAVDGGMRMAGRC